MEPELNEDGLQIGVPVDWETVVRVEARRKTERNDMLAETEQPEVRRRGGPKKTA